MFCVFFAVLELIVYVHANHVPVISWGKSDLFYPSVLAGQETTNDDFSKNYLESLLNAENKDTVVFMQDRLGLHDITLNGNVFDVNSDGGLFKNLKSIVDKNVLFTLPSVEEPEKALYNFKNSFKGNIFNLKHPYNVDNLHEEGTPSLIMVYLPKMQFHNIKKIDDIIGLVTQNMIDSKRLFTALYTGKESSKIPSLSMHSGRNLLAVSNSGNESEIAVISECILFYTTSIQFGYWNKNKYDYVEIPKSYTVTSNCNDTKHGSISLDFTDVVDDNLKSFSLKLDFDLAPDGYWYMKTYANWTYGVESGKDRYMSREVWAPDAYSYHCTTMDFPAILEIGIPTSVIKIKDLQVEIGTIDTAHPEFSYANDCDGYFSIGSVLGLFVALILTLIFAFGITMLSNINTMDRFDDPKGKSIVIPNTE